MPLRRLSYTFDFKEPKYYLLAINYVDTFITHYQIAFFGCNPTALDFGIKRISRRCIGCTAFTYQHVSWGDVALYPKADLMSQAELGLRSQHALICLVYETMYWNQSDIVRDMLQPYSQLGLFGLKAGFSF